MFCKSFTDVCGKSQPPNPRLHFLDVSGHDGSLNAARVERIAAAPPSANPLYLRVLLDELRLVRTHEKLEERIGDYLKAESPYALYEKVIARWKQDYEGDSDLVGDTLSLLWAARRGLTETELLQALGKDGEPLPRAKWSPLFLAMSDALISRGGLLTFAHDFLRTAVENTYLPTEQNQRRAHMRLADFFERQPFSRHRHDELPWQLAKAKEWQRLQMLLSDRGFLTGAWQRNQSDVRTYWTQIETASNLRMEEAYQPQIEEPEIETDKDYLWLLGLLLNGTGHPVAALKLRESLVEHFRVSGDLEGLSNSLNNQAVILKSSGDLDGAMALHKEAEQICRQLDNLDGLRSTLGNEALILQARGNLDGAMALHKEVERICRQLENVEGLAISLANQASVFLLMGREQEGMPLAEEAHRLVASHGYTALAKQFEPIMNALRESSQGD